MHVYIQSGSVVALFHAERLFLVRSLFAKILHVPSIIVEVRKGQGILFILFMIFIGKMQGGFCPGPGETNPFFFFFWLVLFLFFFY